MRSECPDLPIILSSLSFEYQSHPYTSHLSNCQGKEICMPRHLEHQQHLLVAQANFPRSCLEGSPLFSVGVVFDGYL